VVLVDTTHVKTLFFSEKNLRHMRPVLLNKRFFSFFSFFLLSLFAPLNGIHKIFLTHDYQVFFFLLFCALRAQFLCDTALPSWRFWLGTLSSLNYKEFKTENWWVHSSRHFHSSHLKPIQTTRVIRTRTLSNLFAKRIVFPFCKRELHA